MSLDFGNWQINIYRDERPQTPPRQDSLERKLSQARRLTELAQRRDQVQTAYLLLGGR